MCSIRFISDDGNALGESRNGYYIEDRMETSGLLIYRQR